MKILPRPYQAEAKRCVFQEWEEVTSTLVVKPTGTGKTVLFAMVIEAMQPKRAMVVAHREELIWQARDKIMSVTGLECGIEMGDLYVNNSLFGDTPVVVSTIQTQNASHGGRKRMSRFNPKDFGVLVIDECHHGTANSYKDLINYYKSNNPDIKILGVTATPDRADEEALGQVFDSVAFDYEILDAIHDGWLVPIDQHFVSIAGLDFSTMRTTAGDLNGADLASVMEAENNMQGVAGASIHIIGDKRAIAFTASIKQAEQLSSIFNRHKPGCSEWVCGNTPKDDRREILSRFQSGKVQIVCNCGVLCLDEQTEILTDTGWVGIDDMSYAHRVANWDDGKIFFDHPKFIVRRQRMQSEDMIVLETKNRSIRVTEDHRMIFRGRHCREWNIVHAGSLVGVKGELPISGMADPTPEKPLPPRGLSSSIKRRIQANSYNLRKHHGFSMSDSIAEATRRTMRVASLNYSSPEDLTLEECELIGFWIGDGSVSRLQSGGVEFVMVQSIKCRKIIQRIDWLIRMCGFDAVKREMPHRNIVKWSLSRGTGFGPQFRRGVFRIEPYLTKSPNQLLWGLSEAQFDRLISGYWMADGTHHRDNPNAPTNVRICGARYEVLSLLQAIACTRGYRASLTKKRNGIYWLWYLSLTKKSVHQMTKYTMRREAGWRPERVWCVTSTTGNIVTRRRGTVTVVGNTEGFDDPGVEVVIMARPTKSRSLYAQMAGRSTRPLPGIVDKFDTAEERIAAIEASAKPSALIVDFVGNSGKHKLMSSADILGGKVSDDAIVRAVKIAKQSGKPVRMSELLDESEEQLKAEAEKRREAESRRKQSLVAKVTFSSRAINPFDVFGIEPVKVRGWDTSKTLSEKQQALLLKQGINPDSMPYPQARQLINEFFRRWNGKLCSLNQAKVLSKYGYETKNMKRDEASRLMDELAKNGWRRKTPLPKAVEQSWQEPVAQAEPHAGEESPFEQ